MPRGDGLSRDQTGPQQLAAYVSWVNSQLKRKPGLEPITDLRRDLQDGVVLTRLVEIVAGEALEGVRVVPHNKEESRKNVEQVLQFISSRHIRMPHISARDIVDGNLKAVMRTILALAAHFKPSANHRAASGSGRGRTRGSASLSTVALAQGAAATLASARTLIHSGRGLDREKPVCVRALVDKYERQSPEERRNPRSCSLSSLSPPSPPRAPPIHRSGVRQEDGRQPETSVESPHVAVEQQLEDSLGETLEKEVQDARKMVSALQALLLHGSLPEDEEEAPLSLDQGDSEYQLVVVRSRLDQSMEEAQELKRELSSCKQEVRYLQAVKDAQQQRLCTQDASILQMKQELLRASMTKDELTNQNAELQWKLGERNRLWTECKREVDQKERSLQQLKHKLEESHRKQTSTGAENNGYSHPGGSAPYTSGQAEEVQLLRDALRSLRNNVREHDPQQHTLDTLEQGIVSLIDRMQALHAHRGRGKSPKRKDLHADSDILPHTKVCQSPSASSTSTKILYYTGKSAMPSMMSIPKRLGEVTLKDIKAAVDREGNYRYHFKALDPEFGTVKEEVFLDGAIIPGWEGKIVAWVEEDLGEER
ncbi:dixin-like [Brachionichthys hirsutus]|uniref:dixin-like n=1 Tax=Brachionichthys hirsutus TaxID=412623 RepID=UPI003604ACD4